jgi:hypothetical protein
MSLFILIVFFHKKQNWCETYHLDPKNVVSDANKRYEFSMIRETGFRRKADTRLRRYFFLYTELVPWFRLMNLISELLAVMF